MKKGIKIRPSKEEDIEQIDPLLHELIGEPIGDRGAMFKGSLSHEEYFTFVAEEDSDIVGFIDLWLLPDPGHGSQMGYLTNLIVQKARRRGGIGKALVEAVVEAARKNGAAEIHVTTKMDNEPAKKLYNDMGFTKQHTTLELEFGPVHFPDPG